MREQAVVGHADADVDGEEVHDGEGGEVLPGEAEEGGDGPGVEENHDDGGDPVDAALLVSAAHAQVLLDLAGDVAAVGGGEVLVGDGRGDMEGASGRLRARLGGGCFGDEEGWGHCAGLTSEVAVLAVRFDASRARFVRGVRVL